MKEIYQKYRTILEHRQTDSTRYLYDKIAWDSRMIGIVGGRGVGKTTLILQRIKRDLDMEKSLYVSADDLYFSEHRLFDLADEFYKNAGEYLFVDEIHKYENWSQELKNIYDSFPFLKVIFTGSSVLDILKGSSDLSRRAVIYKMKGLSFREYLNFFHQQNIAPFSLEQILKNEVKLTDIKHPLPLFREYLKNGYYPFGQESEFAIRLEQVVVQTLETDIPQYANLNVSTSRKLKRLLVIIAESVPFKPNISKIANLLGVSRGSLDDYFSYMEQAGLIAQLRSETKGIRGLGKVNKVYLENPNLILNLSADKSNIGNIRETFFLNQMSVYNEVTSSKQTDFLIGDYAFEIGGKNKTEKQIKTIANAFIVKDDIEYGYKNEIPLWSFGFNY
ncbi:MAG: AAA family ATPase [Flavobacteriaceae bacterium]|nr:AAA family ATPase [Flavobacteriaceae bacterium]